MRAQLNCPACNSMREHKVLVTGNGSNIVTCLCCFTTRSIKEAEVCQGSSDSKAPASGTKKG